MRHLPTPPFRSPGHHLLDNARKRALVDALSEYRPRAELLAEPLAAGRGDAREALMVLADDGLAFMRRRVAELAGQRNPLLGWLARADHWWGSPSEGEHIDDPDLDETVRRRAMRHLDALNELIRSYEMFFHTMRPDFASDRPTRIIDLASGHAGFALALAQMARRDGLDVAITATDIKAEYLELGAAEAERLGVEVDFQVQDALDLSNLEPGSYDIVCCTQSIHHFPPGMVAVMFASASRLAARAVHFIDGCRTFVKAVPLTALCRLNYRDPILAHDALISCRRFFVPEELELLGRIGPWGEGLQARWSPPGHCVLSLQTT